MFANFYMHCRILNLETSKRSMTEILKKFEQMDIAVHKNRLSFLTPSKHFNEHEHRIIGAEC